MSVVKPCCEDYDARDCVAAPTRVLEVGLCCLIGQVFVTLPRGNDLAAVELGN